MHGLLRGLLLVLCLSGGSACRRGNEVSLAVASTDASVVSSSDDEAAHMVVELFTENRELKARLEEQAGQIGDLERRLAEAMAHLDLARGGRSGALSPRPATAVQVDDLTRVRVLDVNREMQAVVVSGGTAAGMKVGMKFYVLRDDRTVGQIRLIDVRDHVAGGFIEQTEKGSFPETGDRVILSSK